MTRLYLIRHAQAEGNLYRRAQGWYDGPVTPLGRQQIAALERRFRDIPVDAVYASDLRRTQATAQAVAAPRHLELHLDPDLREVGLGVFSNCTMGELIYHHPQLCQAFQEYSPQWQPPEGESFQQVADRMAAAFFRAAARHSGQTVALFSHSAAIRCLQATLRGKHPGEFTDHIPCDNTAVSCYEVQGDRFRILFENDASHLTEEISTLALRKKAARRQGGVPLVWFRPMDAAREGREYAAARREAWIRLHGSLLGFDEAAFLAEAEEMLAWDGRALQRAMWGEVPVGILQLAILQGVREEVGYIPFLYVAPDYRRRGVGLQLVGQAVATYRAMGRKRLRLNCSPDNDAALRLYRRCGFIKVGQSPGAQGFLDLMELPL